MSRILVMVMLAVGLVLSGCASPEKTGGKAQGKQGAEQAVKDDSAAKEKPTKQDRGGSQPEKKEAKPNKPAADKKESKSEKPEAAKPENKPKPQPEPSTNTQPRGSGGNYEATVTVSRVVDGDSIEISPAIAGIVDVRLIGVDTPETVDPNEEVEPWGPEASSFATDALTGQRVGLKFDVEREDHYDRLLAYVYLGGEMFNEVLVEEGYAQAYPYEPNTRYAGSFAAAQEEARAAGLGIWGLSFAQQCLLANHGNGIGEGTPGCSEASATASSSASATSSAKAKPSAGGAVPPISEDHCPQSAPIKGNQSSGIYHMPGGDYYDVTDPEQCFATPQDAETAGYRASEL